MKYWISGTVLYVVFGWIAVWLRAVREPAIRQREFDRGHRTDRKDGFSDGWPEALFFHFLLWWLWIPCALLNDFALSAHGRALPRWQEAARLRKEVERLTAELDAENERWIPEDA